MADVIRIELSGEEFRLLRKMLYRQLATMVDDCLVPHERCKEEYEKADAMAIKVSRAEWESRTPQETTRTEHGQNTDKRQETPVAPSTPPAATARDFQQAPQQSYKPTLPPRQTYQPQTMENAQPSGTGHVISEKQAKRLYAIQMKSGKKQYEVKEYLKRLGFNNSKEVTSDKYDAIINWIQG